LYLCSCCNVSSVNIAVTCTELCFPQTPGTSLGSAKLGIGIR
jgi:hypothetical protein